MHPQAHTLPGWIADSRGSSFLAKQDRTVVRLAPKQFSYLTLPAFARWQRVGGEKNVSGGESASSPAILVNCNMCITE